MLEVKSLCPQLYKMSELFGYWNIETNQWETGLVECIFKQFETDKDFNRKILVFDGELNSIWAESLNSALDES